MKCVICKGEIQLISVIHEKDYKTPRVHFEGRTVLREKGSVWGTQIVCLTVLIIENLNK